MSLWLTGGEDERWAQIEGRAAPVSKYKPRSGDIAPRGTEWQAQKGNTQTPPCSGEVRGTSTQYVAQLRAALSSGAVADLLESTMHNGQSGLKSLNTDGILEALFSRLSASTALACDMNALYR